MSALTRFQPKFTLGNLRYHIDDTKVIDGYLECDGSTVLKNAYPELFNTVGYLKDRQQTLSGTASTSGTLDIEDVIYANGIHVYVGETATIQTSNDGVTWTSRNIDTPTFVGGKTFSRTGNTSTVSVSLTDLTGGVASSPAANDIVFVAVATGSNANTSQAVSDYNQISTSYINGTIDTNLWTGYKVMGTTPDTTITIPSTGSVDDAQTVAIHVWRNLSEYDLSDTAGTGAGSNATVIPNPSAITTVSNNTVLLVIAAGGHSRGTSTYTASYLNNFVSVGANDTFDSTIGMGSVSLTTSQTYDPAAWTFGSTDSISFSNASITIALRPKRLNSVTYGNNVFVVVGNGGFLETSPDATTWTRRESGTTNTINEVIFANNTFVYVGNTGTLATSSDGLNWTLRSSGTSNNINAITYANNTFVYVGNGGVLATSPNAVSWTTRTSGTTSNINTITQGNNIFVYAGDGGVLRTSTDAITWTSRTSGTAQNINDLSYSNIDNEFAYIANAGVFRTSSNAITWTARTSGITNNINAITYGSGFVYVGDGGAYATASYYNYNPQIEFKLPSSDVYNIFVENENTNLAFTPRAYIKYE